MKFLYEDFDHATVPALVCTYVDTCVVRLFQKKNKKLGPFPAAYIYVYVCMYIEVYLPQDIVTTLYVCTDVCVYVCTCACV